MFFRTRPSCSQRGARVALASFIETRSATGLLHSPAYTRKIVILRATAPTKARESTFTGRGFVYFVTRCGIWLEVDLDDYDGIKQVS